MTANFAKRERNLKHVSAAALCLMGATFFAACGGGGAGELQSGGPNPNFPNNPNNPPQTSPQQPDEDDIQMSLAAGMAEIEGDQDTSTLPDAELLRFGVTPAEVDRVYRLTTPIDEDFRFNIVATRPGNAGETKLKIGHVRAGADQPVGGAETIVGEGMRIDTGGSSVNGDWLEVEGDGFVRATITGKVDKHQVLIVDVPQPDGDDLTVAVEIGLGAESEINVEDETVGSTNLVKSEETIFSSDSHQFGLPAIAVSGDRFSVVTYDGMDSNSANFWEWGRSRRWLQYNETTGEVTGNSETVPAWDAGFWRDQEIAAKGNVLAIAYTGDGALTADISLDRGETFPITQSFDTSSWGQRLVNLAIAEDYTLALLYWRTQGTDVSNSESELVLIEATPTSIDQTSGTPTGYDFGAPQVIHNPGKNVTPLLMHLEYSEAGDLVVGYGYTEVNFPNNPGLPALMVETRASYRCAVRKTGEVAFDDKELDFEEGVQPADPNVALVGGGQDLEVFFAYEKSDGIHLMYSDDCGDTFNPVANFGLDGAAQPSVHARMQGGSMRVDVLFLNPTVEGLELHTMHWDDFAGGTGTSEQNALTEAVTVDTGTEATDRNGAMLGFANKETISLAWFGYDAVTVDDDIAVVFHEEKTSWSDFLMRTPPVQNPNMPIFVGGFGGALDANLPGATAVPQVVLAPGMGGQVGSPNSDDRNQLKVMLVD